MDKESQNCGLCSLNYNTTDRIPRIIISCAHTLCSLCLTKIINTPDLRKCPFDNHVFSEAQESLEKFPLNVALLTLLEGQKQKICQVHDREFTDICLQDRMKICPDCALSGEHKSHSVKKIKELRAKGIQVKNDLEERIKKLEKNKDVEKMKKKCLGKMESKVGEFNKILKAKHLEWRKQVESFFETNTGSRFKKEASKVIEEIDQAVQNEEYLTFLDRDFSSLISRIQPQVVKEEVSRFAEQTYRMMNSLESFLVSQAKSLREFYLSHEKIKSEEPMIEEEISEQKQQEEPQQISSENPTEIKEKFGLVKSVLRFGIGLGLLKIWVRNEDLMTETIDLNIPNKMKRVNVVFGEYDSLFQDSNDLDNLPQILDQLNYYTSLFIDFSSSGLTDVRALTLLKLLFPRIQHLTEISISFGECEITNQPISFFCTEILPKAISLKDLTLKLGSPQINNLSLPPFSQSLETFHLEAGKTGLTDDCVEKMLHAVEGVKELNLCLSRTRITDHSLRVLGNHMMSCMKNLERFTLDGSKTEITMEGINAIFTGVPKNIRELVLIFEGISLSDEVVSLFEEKVCPKLEVVEHVVLTLEGTDLKAKMSTILKPITREAEKRKRVNERKERTFGK